MREHTFCTQTYPCCKQTINAPVQASYLGFPSTLGAHWVPWLIVDEVRYTHGYLFLSSLARLSLVPTSAAALGRICRLMRASSRVLDRASILYCFQT